MSQDKLTGELRVAARRLLDLDRRMAKEDTKDSELVSPEEHDKAMQLLQDALDHYDIELEKERERQEDAGDPEAEPVRAWENAGAPGEFPTRDPPELERLPEPDIEDDDEPDPEDSYQAMRERAEAMREER